MPFEYDWKIVTVNDLIVSGIHLQWRKVVPKRQIPRFSEPARFEESRVIDDYIELRFEYRSVYAYEVPNANLSGKLTKAYRLTPDRQYCVPTELQQ